MAPAMNPVNYYIPLSNRKLTLQATSISLQVVAWMAVALRLWARFKMVRAPGWDDLCVTLAALISLLGIVSINREIPNGLGLHLDTILYKEPDGKINYETYNTYLFWFFVANITYATSTSLVKLSILFQYMRLFPKRGHPNMHRIFLALVIIVVGWGIAYFFIMIFDCSPVEKGWKPQLHGKCSMFGSMNTEEAYRAYASHTATNMCLDIFILSVPLPLLVKLKLGRKQKAGLIGLFSIGTIVVICAALRLWLIVKSHAGTYPTVDPPWYAPPIVIMSCLEVNLAIATASMPIFWPFLSSFGSGTIAVMHEVIVHSETRKTYFSNTNGTDASLARRSGSDASDLHLRDGGDSNSNVADQHRKYYGDRHVAGLVVGNLDQFPGDADDRNGSENTHHARAWFEPIALDNLPSQRKPGGKV